MTPAKTFVFLLVLAVIGVSMAAATSPEAVEGYGNRKLLFVPAWAQPQPTGLEAFGANIGNFLNSAYGQVTGALEPIAGACF